MKKILIVEDEQFLSDMYKMKFEHEGYKAVVAKDGPEGLELAKKEKPDLVLLDLVLPGMDGFKVLSELKKDSATKGIKVFIFSNLGQNSEIEKGEKTGADGYFIKANMTPSQLMEKINGLFNDKKEIKKDKSTQVKKEDDYKIVEKKSARILLIEDEEAIINMYQLRFEKEGLQIEVARNGAWGLKLLQKKI